MAVPEGTKAVAQDHSGCREAIGYVIDVNPPEGDAACWLDIGPTHISRNNLLHGGLMATLLDVACGNAASLSYEKGVHVPVLTVSLNILYVAPVGSGRVTATGRVSGGGRKICYASGELRDSDGNLIASATGVFKRFTKRPIQ